MRFILHSIVLFFNFGFCLQCLRRDIFVRPLELLILMALLGSIVQVIICLLAGI